MTIDYDGVLVMNHSKVFEKIVPFVKKYIIFSRIYIFRFTKLKSREVLHERVSYGEIIISF